ncbi:MAG: cysteine hydrolase family protein [Anaerolineales bacterium]
MSIAFVPRGTVEVPEISFEDSVHLPAENAALIVVDMQNDFVKEGGNLIVPAAGDTVASIQRLLEAARAHGVHIAYTQDTMAEDDPEFDIWPQHCLKGTWGWKIIEELEPHPEDLICQKNRYDGFYGTWLDHFLSRVWDVEHLVIVGTVANICVLHTAASAGLRYFHVVVPANGISALNDFDQALALHQISWLYKGSVVQSTEDIHFEG